MEYNSRLKKLVLPDYGRNVQNMVDHCLTIEDREERQRCANTIIDIMGSIFPHLRDVNDFKHILWDHLAIMSDFKLDIDYPYEIVKKENINTKPDKVPYSQSGIRYRHYGKTIEQLIQRATEYEDGPERDALVLMLANDMKRSLFVWNREAADDHKVFKDLAEMSGGKIVLDETQYKLSDCKDLIPPTPQPQQRNNNNNKKNRKNR